MFEMAIRGDGKYELKLYERVYVLTRAELDELHELIESVNVAEAKQREVMR